MDGTETDVIYSSGQYHTASIQHSTEIIELSKLQMDVHMRAKVGSVMEVLFEDLKPNGEIAGFTDNYCQVFVKGSDELLGKIVKVKIISNSRTSLKGELLN